MLRNLGAACAVLAILLLSGGPALAGPPAAAPAVSGTVLPPGAVGQPDDEDLAPECEVGAFLTALYDVHPQDNDFSARVWMWSLCPTEDADPLETATFPQGYSPSKTDPIKRKVGDQFYTLLGFDGTFRHLFDRTTFPFDEHTLEIRVASFDNITQYRMTPDPETDQNGFSHYLSTPRWDIKDLRVTTEERDYPTDFGDHSDPSGRGTAFSVMKISIDVDPSDTRVFWELAGPLFIIFLITFLTFLMTGTEAGTFAGRITALGASLFAVLVNFNKVGELLPSTSGFTMLGKLHLLTLGYVVVAMGITVASWRWVAHEKNANKIKRLNQIGILIGVIFYVGGTIALVLQAALAARS